MYQTVQFPHFLIRAATLPFQFHAFFIFLGERIQKQSWKARLGLGGKKARLFSILRLVLFLLGRFNRICIVFGVALSPRVISRLQYQHNKDELRCICASFSAALVKEKISFIVVVWLGYYCVRQRETNLVNNTPSKYNVSQLNTYCHANAHPDYTLKPPARALKVDLSDLLKVRQKTCRKK